MSIDVNVSQCECCDMTLIAIVAWLTMTGVSLPAEANCDSQARSTYLLGPDDEVEIAGPHLDERAVTMRIDGDGDVQVPLVGRVHIADLTVQQAQQDLDTRFSTYIRDPQITISVCHISTSSVGRSRQRYALSSALKTSEAATPGSARRYKKSQRSRTTSADVPGGAV